MEFENYKKVISICDRIERMERQVEILKTNHAVVSVTAVGLSQDEDFAVRVEAKKYSTDPDDLQRYAINYVSDIRKHIERDLLELHAQLSAL